MACLVGVWPVFAQKTEVPYCVDPQWLPYEAIKNNQHIGLSSDYIKRLNEQTDYHFKLVKTNSWQQSLDFIKSGRCWLLPMLNQTPERNVFLDFSDTYFTAPNFLVSRQDQPFLQSLENIGSQTLGVTHGYRITEFINKNYPSIQTIEFNSEVEGIQAVADGEIDLFIGSVLSINNHIKALGLTNLKLAGWGGVDDLLKMGMAKGHQSILNEINKVLAQITTEQRAEIYNHWNDVTVIDNTNYRLIWQVIIGFMILLFTVIMRYSIIRNYNQQLTQKNQQLKQLQLQLVESNAELQSINQHDDLTGLYNRHYFNQLIASGLYSHSNEEPLCLIFLDIDFFKTINDNHGHIIGDQVLRSFGKLLKSCCDIEDVVGRWGGEEFVILKKPANIQDAAYVCQKIQQQLQSHEFIHKQPLTCSFGVAQIRPNESLMDCFNRADQMLYQAKNEGRNQICYAT